VSNLAFRTGDQPEHSQCVVKGVAFLLRSWIIPSQIYDSLVNHLFRRRDSLLQFFGAKFEQGGLI
jgi:hypothetical protein